MATTTFSTTPDSNGTAGNNGGNLGRGGDQQQDNFHRQPHAGAFAPRDAYASGNSSINPNGRQQGTATISQVLGGMGMVMSGQSSPELNVAAQQINNWEKTRQTSGVVTPMRALARVFDGPSNRLPGGRSILVMAVVDTNAGVASYTIINSMAAVANVSKLLRQVQHQVNDLGSAGTDRSFQRPNTIAEEVMFGEVKESNGTVVPVVNHISTLVHEWLCQTLSVSNMLVSQCGILLTPMEIGVNRAAALNEADVQRWFDALSNMTNSTILANTGMQLAQSFRDLAPAHKNINVAIQPGRPDQYRDDGIAIKGNLSFVVTIGNNQQRFSAYGSGNEEIQQLGVVYADATIVRHPKHNSSEAPNRSHNPLFSAVLTITSVQASSQFSGMGALLKACVAHAITPADVVSATLPLIIQPNRDPGVVGYFSSYGSNKQKLDVPGTINMTDLIRDVISMTSDLVQVRMQYDPADLSVAVMERDTFLSTYGETSEQYCNAIYTQLEALFGTTFEKFIYPGKPSGLIYTGNVVYSGAPQSLSWVDMIAVLTSVPGDMYLADTLPMIYFTDTALQDCLTEHYKMLNGLVPHAQYHSIAFGILLEPEYLTGLLRAMQNAGFRVTVSGNNNEALRTRDYDMNGGFNSRSGRSASSARRFQ